MKTNNTQLTYDLVKETIGIFLENIYPVHSSIQYRLIGTSAALMQGVELPVSDIDILVKERKDIDIIIKQLSSFQCTYKPSWMNDSRQYFCSYLINNINIEFSTVEIENETDTIESFGNGPWLHYTDIQCGKYNIPTVTLELRLITELVRNRPERYNPIIKHLKENKCDIEYLTRAFEVINIDTNKKKEILEYLGV